MSWGDHYTPTKNSFTLNGKLMDPTADPSQQTNPFDPNDPNQFQQYQDWENSNHGSAGATEVGSDFSPAALATIIGGQLAMGVGQGGAGLGGVGGGGAEDFSTALASAEGIGGGVGPTAAEVAGSAAMGGGGAAGAAGIPSWMKTAGTIGQGLMAANGGAAQGRLAESNANIAQSKAELDRYNAALLGNRQATSTQQLDYENAIRGDLLSGIQDVNVHPPDYIQSRMGTVTGGLRPSAMPNRAAIGEQMRRTALLDLMSGKAAGAGLAGQAGITLPNAPVQPQQGGVSKTLDWLGPALTIASSYLAGRK